MQSPRTLCLSSEAPNTSDGQRKNLAAQMLAGGSSKALTQMIPVQAGTINLATSWARLSCVLHRRCQPTMWNTSRPEDKVSPRVASRLLYLQVCVSLLHMDAARSRLGTQINYASRRNISTPRFLKLESSHSASLGATLAFVGPNGNLSPQVTPSTTQMASETQPSPKRCGSEFDLLHSIWLFKKHSASNAVFSQGQLNDCKVSLLWQAQSPSFPLPSGEPN